MAKIIEGHRVGRNGTISVGCSAVIFDKDREKILLTRREDNNQRRKMRTHFMFHTLAFFIAVLTFSMPFGTLAQQHSWRVEAKIAAERDAQTDINKPLWFGAGCLLLGASGSCVGCLSLESPLVDVMLPGVWAAGIAGSYFYRPDPPAERLLGKSPEYVAFYTDAYKAKTGTLQATWTTVGCASGVLATGAVALILLIAWVSSDWPP